MNISLARKEFRELLPIGLVALACQLYLLAVATHVPLGNLQFLGQSRSTIPFSANDSITFTFFVAGLASIALALRQTMWESGRGTFLFLLHRPLPRTAIFGTKLLVGCGIFLFIVALPLACYSLWAATPGTHPSPFFWRMTVDYWDHCLPLTILYFTAFLSGLRPGRLYASRFLPLVGGFVMALLAMGAPYVLHWPAGGTVIALLIDVCLVAAILWVARTRDYS